MCVCSDDSESDSDSDSESSESDDSDHDDVAEYQLANKGKAFVQVGQLNIFLVTIIAEYACHYIAVSGLRAASSACSTCSGINYCCPEFALDHKAWPTPNNEAPYWHVDNDCCKCDALVCYWNQAYQNRVIRERCLRDWILE